MAYLLNIIYLLLLAVASPWLAWQAWRTGKYREGWGAKFLGRVLQRTGSAHCLWIHAVSVGEVNLLATLIERWERLHPEWEIVISTTTHTGLALAQKRYAPRTVFYCPLDFTWAVGRAMRAVRPDLVVLTELELWPNLIRAARQHGAKVAVINGRLSEKSYRGYRRIGWLVQRVLAQVDLIAVQNGEYAQRFFALGAPSEAVHTTGSIKFDGARTDRNNPDTVRLALLAGIAADDVVFLAGSTQDPEESLALDAYEQLVAAHPRLRLILVPRHPERFDAVAELLNCRGIRWQRRSRLDVDRADPGARVLLVDAVGELGAWWGAAQIAFVGGSMGQRGGQNMIEPSAYGAAVSFGPNTWNFHDVVSQLLAHQAAIMVQDGRKLTEFVRRCLEDPGFAAELGLRARTLVLQQQGAADRTISLLDQLHCNDGAGSASAGGRRSEVGGQLATSPR
ncbi:MAG: 3-deoxy-D-manno-octulosonic acid transferase [Planctomycetaceae bacterium]|nr:3-deoxy-D-manno-octulosonic acid transferase [Planctomycetaceae bacterium]